MRKVNTFNKDEVYITKIRPQLKKKDVFVAESALAVHVASGSNRRTLEGELKLRMNADHATEARIGPLRALLYRYAASTLVSMGEACCAPDCPLLPLLTQPELMAPDPVPPPALDSWGLGVVLAPPNDTQLALWYARFDFDPPPRPSTRRRRGEREPLVSAVQMGFAVGVAGVVLLTLIRRSSSLPS
eukprot:Hpha_TRINITY_DN20384_c0_g1::TRINITY_DN20384_c0_g1_i1::g.138093::m.138093